MASGGGTSWGVLGGLGASWSILGCLEGVLRASWRRLGASWRRLGVVLGRFERSWGRLERDFHGIPSWIPFCTRFVTDLV